MKKKNWVLIIIILGTVLLIATVIWIYAKRIEHIESKMKISPIAIRAKLLLHLERRQAEDDLPLLCMIHR
jgi:hypothetical protein